MQICRLQLFTLVDLHFTFCHLKEAFMQSDAQLWLWNEIHLLAYFLRTDSQAQVEQSSVSQHQVDICCDRDHLMLQYLSNILHTLGFMLSQRCWQICSETVTSLQCETPERSAVCQWAERNKQPHMEELISKSLTVALIKVQYFAVKCDTMEEDLATE